MNLATTIKLQAGGPGSGCKGPNCGRPAKSMGNIDKGPVKGLGTLPDDPDNRGRQGDGFWVAPDGEVYRQSALLGPGFHEHWTHARELMNTDPKKFAWIKEEWDASFPKKEIDVKDWFTGKYRFVEALIAKGGIRAYATVGSHANWDTGIEAGRLNEKVLGRVQALVNQLPGKRYRVDYKDENGSFKAVEGSEKEVMRDLRKAFYKS